MCVSWFKVQGSRGAGWSRATVPIPIPTLVGTGRWTVFKVSGWSVSDSPDPSGFQVLGSKVQGVQLVQGSRFFDGGPCFMVQGTRFKGCRLEQSDSPDPDPDIGRDGTVDRV